MYTVHIKTPRADDDRAPAMIISTEDVVTSFTKGLTPEKANDFHQHSAERIADALWKSLPGGTLDRLTAELMRRMASSLVVVRRP